MNKFFMLITVLGATLLLSSCAEKNALKGYEWLEGKWIDETYLEDNVRYDWAYNCAIITKDYYQSASLIDDKIILDVESKPKNKMSVKRAKTQEKWLKRTKTIDNHYYIDKKRQQIFWLYDFDVKMYMKKVSDMGAEEFEVSPVWRRETTDNRSLIITFDRQLDYALLDGHIKHLNLSNTVLYFSQKGSTYIFHFGDDVKKISPSFAMQFYMTSIILPKSVTSINFTRCKLLKSISIPDSVTEIEVGAFEHCTSLTSIDIPNSVTTIGGHAFWNCTSLTSINIPNSVTTIGYGAFFGCSSITSVTIPNSVSKIAIRTFDECTSLISVTLHDSVKEIGDAAFRGCKSLTSIVIPDSVTKLGSYAFYDCESLNTVTLSNSLSTIHDGTFSACNSLTSITIPKSVKFIGSYAFGACNSLVFAKVPEDLKYYSQFAFSQQTTTVEFY